MSYDLAVWYTEQRLDNQQAGELYCRLCDEITEGVMAHPSIEAFYNEIISIHPEIDNVPEERLDDLDYCPWSIAFDRSAGHIIMCCVWPKSEYCHDLIGRLARKHGLALFDPQTESISYPDQNAVVEQSGKPWWKFW